MPDWSPNGARIVFVRNWSLYVVNADGSALRRLPPLGAVQDPIWSPDGRSIAFDAHEATYTIRPDGSRLSLLASFPGVVGSGAGLPSWSPDGTRIAFFRTPYQSVYRYTGEVWVMNANGTHRRRVYRQALPIGEPARPEWSPDGRYIAFGSEHNLPSLGLFVGIYLMDANGRHLHQLKSISMDTVTVSDFSNFSDPAWQPIP